MTAVRRAATCSSTVAQRFRHVRRSSALEKPRDQPPRHLPERQVEHRSRESRLQRQGRSTDVNFQVPDVHRAITAVRDLTGSSPRMERIFGLVDVGGSRKRDVGSSFLTVDSLFEVSLGFSKGETEALPPANHDRKNHEPDLPIELRAPRVKRGPRGPTADEISQHEPLHLPFRSWCPISIAVRGPDDPQWRRGEDDVTHRCSWTFCFSLGAKSGDKQPTVTVLVLVDRVSGDEQGCVGTHVSVCVRELGLVGTH